MFTEIRSYEEFLKLKAEETAVLGYFSTEKCNVCKVLKPKVAELIDQEFPKMKLVFVDAEKVPEAAAQNRVFTSPTILVFFDGRETIRKSRSIGIDELRREISRPYSLIFSE